LNPTSSHQSPLPRAFIQDVLSLPEVELMAVLDAGLPTARAAIAHVSEAACPPCNTVRFHPTSPAEPLTTRGDSV
jgi:hypothetical protein